MTKDVLLSISGLIGCDRVEAQGDEPGSEPSR